MNELKEMAVLKGIILGVLLVILFLLWLLLDFTWGRHVHVKGKQNFSHPQRHSNIHIFTSGIDLFEDFFKEIKQAKRHIHVLFYIVKYDQFSQDFLNLLQSKAKNGLEVRLMVDWMGGFRIPYKRIKELRKNGVYFAYSCKPKLPFIFYSLQKRNHRKITVIDGQIGYLGGFNIGKEYIDMDPILHPWRDYHLKLQGEGVQDLQFEFLHDWLAATKENLLSNKAYFPLTCIGKSRHQFIPTAGFGLEETLTTLIKQAKKSIIIGTPYFIPSPALFETLRSAIKNNIDVRIIVPKKADHAFVKEASFPYFRILIKEGAKVFQFQRGFYHSKILLIDDTICDIGTANFDRRSLFLNYEMNCLVYEPECIQEIKEKIQEDINYSTPLPAASLAKIKVLESIKEKIAYTLSAFL